MLQIATYTPPGMHARVKHWQRFEGFQSAKWALGDSEYAAAARLMKSANFAYLIRASAAGQMGKFSPFHHQSFMNTLPGETSNN